jgi:hypothetical protein
MENLALTVKSEIPIFLTNFVELKEKLIENLKLYEIRVTLENIKEAKEAATDLNKLSGEIEKKRKEETKKVSEPIRNFEAKVKELVLLCQDSRTKILEQVKIFEDETRNNCLILLDEFFEATWKEEGIRGEFVKSEISDLAIISNITGAGNLTKTAKDEVVRRIAEVKSLQIQKDNRLLKLENECLKSGLQSTIPADYIKPFLNLRDEDYNQKLLSLISQELIRQNEIEKKAQEAERKRIEDENLKQETEHNTKKEEEKTTTIKRNVEIKEDFPETTLDRHFKVRCTFDVSMNSTVEELQNNINQLFQSNNFDNIFIMISEL